MKSVHIRSFSGPYFPAFRRNMEWSEYLFVCSPNAGKYGPEKLQGQCSYFISHKTIFYPRTYSKKLNNVEQENLVFSLQLLISCQRSYFIPSEDTRKPDFLVFSGGTECEHWPEVGYYSQNNTIQEIQNICNLFVLITFHL